MKTKFFAFAFVVLLVSITTGVVDTFAGPAITWRRFSSQADLTAHLASDDTTTIATSVVRAGGSLSPEVATGNFTTFTDTADIAWNINGDNAFTLFYNADNGNYSLDVSNINGAVQVNTGPSAWFNELAFSFGVTIANINFTGNISGESFSLNTSWESGPVWDGILFSLPEFDAGNIESFTVSGNIGISTPFPGLSDNDFRGEAYLVQNIAPVPEPTSMALFFTGIIALATSRFRRKPILC